MEFKLISGETITLRKQPRYVLDFIVRAQLAAHDPTVNVGQMIGLIYGLENPLLDKTMLPGRAMATKAVLENPAWRVMSDLLGVKQIQLGLLDPVAAAAMYKVSVNDASKRLGITPASVRAAINARKLAARLVNGQWWLSEESIASYKVSNRGRRKLAKKA
jgi:hypothetical protein